MYNKTIEITANSWPEFISSNEICVVRAKISIELGFNSILKSQFELHYKEKVSTAWINTANISYKEHFIQQLLKEWMPKIGIPVSLSVLPGYYLFHKGALTAYHPGTMQPHEVDARVQGIALIASILSGLIVGLAENDTEKGIETFISTIEGPQAIKVFHFFKEVLDAAHRFNFRSRQQSIYETELEKAYRILGVSPFATDGEIGKAYRVLMKKYHPDKHGINKEENTRITAEINNAYQLIKQSRANQKPSNN